MKQLLILGDGTFAIEALDIAEETGEFQPVGFVNSVRDVEPGTMHSDLPVFGIDSLPFTPADCVLVCAIVSTRRRGFIETMEARGYRFATLIHPSSVVSKRATLGDGCIVHANTVISSSTVIGRHVIVNRGALVGHDVTVGDVTTIGPGANIAGAVAIGAGSYIGVGAVLRDHLTVGNGSVVGAGALVVDAVPDNVLVTGVPARIMRTGVDGL